MKTLSMLTLALASVLVAAACHHAAKTPPAGPPTGGGGDALTAQIDQGKSLYGAHCAGCHGDAGQGTDKGPPVVGADAFPLHPRDGAKRDVDFHTAADIFGWATKNMPADHPGSLSTDQYLAIFAFDLTANGVKLTAPLDGPAAQAIVLHP